MLRRFWQKSISNLSIGLSLADLLIQLSSFKVARLDFPGFSRLATEAIIAFCLSNGATRLAPSDFLRSDLRSPMH
jgi:hypothetical protein